MSALSRIFDRLHADTDAMAAEARWTVTRTRWGGRSYGWTIPAHVPTTAEPLAAVVDLSAYRSTRSTRSTSIPPTYGDAA